MKINALDIKAKCFLHNLKMESVDEFTEDRFFRPQTPRKISSESLCSSSKRSSTISLISQGSLNRLIKEANEDPTTEN